MLCAPAGVADEVWVVDGAAEEVASLVAELLHAPITATAANAATPVATVLVFFTKNPSRRYRELCARFALQPDTTE
jgi:hypothetical protein